MKKIWLPLILAAAFGLAIALVDSRPTWDDTAITVIALFLAAGLLGLFTPRWPWLVALALGIWVPVFELPAGHGAAPLVALAVAFAGVYAGVLARKGFSRQPTA